MYHFYALRLVRYFIIYHLLWLVKIFSPIVWLLLLMSLWVHDDASTTYGCDVPLVDIIGLWTRWNAFEDGFYVKKNVYRHVCVPVPCFSW